MISRYHVRRVQSEADFDRWARFVAGRYLAQKFLDPSECPDGLARDEYDPYSIHFSLLREEDAEEVGVFRFVISSPIGLPIRSVFALEAWPDWFELTRVISRRKAAFLERGRAETNSSVVPAVCHAMAFAKMNGLPGFLAMVDPVLFAHVNLLFANTLEPVSGLAPRFYKGGWLMAVRMSAARFCEERGQMGQVIDHHMQLVTPSALSCRG